MLGTLQENKVVVIWVATLAVSAAGVLAATSDGTSTQAPYEGTADDFMQISQLYVQYHYGLNMRDVVARANTFIPDGVFQPPESCQLNMGRGAVPGHKPMPTMDTPPPSRPGQEIRLMAPMSIPGPIVYQDKDHATVHSVSALYREMGPDKEVALDVGGVYDDKLVRVDGKWKFAYRHTQKRMPPDFKVPPCPPQQENGFEFYMFPWEE